MQNRFIMILFFLLVCGNTGLWAQDGEETAPEGGSSQQVEESDEAFRRRMELEDARQRDPGFADPVDTYQRELEKIDKLPDESRDNIRDQLIDIIMENGEWEPGDALKEYPYEPTAAAQADAELMQQEQEAWDEQIQKYHERESQAFGAYRGPVAGPGNPSGQEGGAEGSEQGSEGAEQGGQQGSGQGQQDGQDGSEGSEGAQDSAGTYQPYQSGSQSSADETSTEGVSESALDFLMRGRATGSEQTAADPQASAPDTQQAQKEAAQSAAQPEPQTQPQDSQQAQAQQEQASEEQSQQQAEQQAELDTRGIIAIEDLDKLRGAGAAPPPPEEEQEDP